MKTEMRTSEVAMTALVTSPMAMLVAAWGSEEVVSIPVATMDFSTVMTSGA